MFFNDKYHCNLNYSWSPPDTSYSYFNMFHGNNSLHFLFFVLLKKMKCDLSMAEKVSMITTWSNSKAQDVMQDCRGLTFTRNCLTSED